MIEKEFVALYETYSEFLFHYIGKLVNYQDDLAEELTQETFYQIFISFDRFRGECDIKTWMCQIAKNTCYRQFRKNKRLKCMSDLSDFTDVLECLEKSPEDIFVQKEQRNKLIQLIMQLKPKYRDLLLMYYFDELSIREIANQMRITENDVKVVLHRGKKTLKKKLGSITL
ncbi:MAG: hypothetical protein K0S47_756 [Herbinix sp.]|jgi:RNA polymerase sigma-70 factor (ECF subfamily)|nr:hypothetical protein [Herbinix sp.]